MSKPATVGGLRLHNDHNVSSTDCDSSLVTGLEAGLYRRSETDTGWPARPVPQAADIVAAVTLVESTADATPLMQSSSLQIEGASAAAIAALECFGDALPGDQVVPVLTGNWCSQNELSDTVARMAAI